MDELRIKLSNPTEIDTGINLLKTLAKPVSSVGSIGKLDLDFLGEGDEIIVRLSDAERRATDNRTMQQALEIIRRRIDEVGTREPTIQRQGSDRILIRRTGRPCVLISDVVLPDIIRGRHQCLLLSSVFSPILRCALLRIFEIIQSVI